MLCKLGRREILLEERNAKLKNKLQLHDFIMVSIVCGVKVYSTYYVYSLVTTIIYFI